MLVDTMSTCNWTEGLCCFHEWWLASNRLVQNGEQGHQYGDLLLCW